MYVEDSLLDESRNFAGTLDNKLCQARTYYVVISAAHARGDEGFGARMNYLPIVECARQRRGCPHQNTVACIKFVLIVLFFPRARA